jgi:hypothetical protein
LKIVADITRQLVKAYTRSFDAMRRIKDGEDMPLYLLRLSNTSPGYVLKEKITSGWLPAERRVKGGRLLQVVVPNAARLKNLDETIAVSINGKVYQREDSDEPDIFTLEPFYNLYCRATGETWNP